MQRKYNEQNIISISSNLNLFYFPAFFYFLDWHPWKNDKHLSVKHKPRLNMNEQKQTGDHWIWFSTIRGKNMQFQRSFNANNIALFFFIAHIPFVECSSDAVARDKRAITAINIFLSISTFLVFHLCPFK